MTPHVTMRRVQVFNTRDNQPTGQIGFAVADSRARVHLVDPDELIRQTVHYECLSDFDPRGVARFGVSDNPFILLDRPYQPITVHFVPYGRRGTSSLILSDLPPGTIEASARPKGVMTPFRKVRPIGSAVAVPLAPVDEKIHADLIVVDLIVLVPRIPPR